MSSTSSRRSTPQTLTPAPDDDQAGCGNRQLLVGRACSQPNTSSQMIVARQRQDRSESVRGVTDSTGVRDFAVVRTGTSCHNTVVYRRVLSAECVRNVSCPGQNVAVMYQSCSAAPPANAAPTPTATAPARIHSPASSRPIPPVGINGRSGSAASTSRTAPGVQVLAGNT